MADFTMRLAEISISVHCCFDETKEYCRDYLTDDLPEVDITVTAEDIITERHRADEKPRGGVSIQSDFSDACMETLALYRKITEALLPRDILLLHGCCIACGGRAYLFTAPSGTGKTTHCRLWLEHIPGCHILNGDKPLLLFRENGIYACGTPWQGKEQLGCSEILSVGGICLLERDTINHITPISFGDALSTLVRQSYIPRDSAALGSVMRLISRLSAVKLYRMGCNLEPEAAQMAYRGMVEESAP